MALRSKQSSRKGIGKHFSRIPQAIDNPQVTAVRYVVIILIVVTGLLHFRAAFFAQLSRNQGSEMAAFSHSLTNPDALATLAREEHLRDADLHSAQLLYKKALENFVLHLPSWLGIAEVLNDQGNVTQAINVLEFIHNRYNNGENTTWSKTLLASTLGQEQILTENLIWLLDNSKAKKKDVFALATLTWAEPDVLMNKLGRDYYVDILREYIKHNELEKSMTVWDAILNSNSIQLDVAVHYVNYLLGQNAFPLATKVWSDTIGPGKTLLYNGNFEEPILGSGFGWRISSSPRNASWEKGEYGSGLKITFDGTENVSFQLSQTLPLNPGKYFFNGTLETDDLTTDQLPFWKIQGVKCMGLDEKGEMVLPNQHPTEFLLPFTMPEDCELVRISLQRKKSYHFDNKIGGKTIVNNLTIKPQEDTSSTVSQPVTQIRILPRVKKRSQKEEETNISINKMSVKP